MVFDLFGEEQSLTIETNNATGFDEFCGGPLWNESLTWLSSPPDLTKCFQHSVVVWLPCGFLWLCLPFQVWRLLTSHNRSLPPTKLSTAKLVICLLASLVVCLDIVWYFTELKDTSLIQLVSPVILTVTLIVAAGVYRLHVRHGSITSGVLFLFWLLLAVCGIVPFYSKALRASRTWDPDEVSTFATFFVYYALILTSLILSCVADKPPYQHFTKEPCPESKASFLSRLLFCWLNSTMVLGYKKPLEESDMWDLHERDKSSHTIPILEKAWEEELQRCHWNSCRSSPTSHSDEPCVSSDTAPLVTIETAAKKKHPSLLLVLTKVYGPRLIVAHSCKVVYDILNFSGPLLQGALIAFSQLESEEKRFYRWKGFMYASLFFLYTVVGSVFFQSLFHVGMNVGMQVKATIMAAVFKKALTVSNEARRETTVGEIVNLMSVDAERLRDCTGYLWMLWSCPLQISIALYLLYNLLGPSVFAGLGVMLVLVPINGGLAAVMQKLENKQMELKDKRIKLMNEVLNGIKVLKLYAWELSFQEKIAVYRDLELSNLLKYSYIGAGTWLTWTLASFLVMLVTLAVYVSMGHPLDPGTAFVALTLFNILQFPINLLPMLISFMVMASVSLRRVSKFLLQGDIDRTNVQHSELSDNAVEIKNGTFSWASEEPAVLNNINIQIAPGSLVAVVGQVGQGKSSLLAAMLGEMEKNEGEVNVNGSVAYVAQQAWIQNATLKDNVLFNTEFEQAKYDEALEVCAMLPDLEMFAAGDQTEIGEKGINLSGGQKQRVSLARAVYKDADIYFLDDPLSAVDAHVGKHIFNRCISNDGVLRGKTRILVTHGIHWLPDVDHILVVAGGTISEAGDYDTLLSHNGPFAQILKTYLTEVPEEELDEETKETREKLLKRVESIEEPYTPEVFPGAPVFSSSPPQHPVGSLQSQGSHEESPSRKTISRKSSIIEDNTDKKVAKPNQGTLIEEEKAEIGRVKLSVFMTYIRSVGILNTVIITIAYMGYQGASIGANLWLSRWTEDPVFNGSTPMNDSHYIYTQDVYLGVYGAFGGGQALLVLFFAMYSAMAMVRASRILHGDLVSNILRAPMAFFDTTPMGRILNRFSRDIETIDGVLPNIIYQWINSFFMVLAGVVVITYSSPIFLVVILPLAIMYYFIQRFYVPTSRQLKRLESTSRSPIFSHFSESIAGAATIRAYGLEEEFMEHSARLVDNNMVYYFCNITSNRWLNFRLDLLSAIVICSVAVFAVVQDNSGGIVGLSISYALQMCEEFNWMVRMTSDVETNIVSVERVAEYANTVPEAEWYIEDTKPQDDWPREGALKFSNYATRYRDDLDLVIQDISLDIKGGEKIGIVGRTGAGKSSLTVALFRIIESAMGQIEIDGIPIHTLGLHQLRNRLTILPQDPVLFSGSLRMNLDPFSKYGDEDIWLALERSHLKVYVEGLSAGLDHEVGEGGQNLSVGQRQLICLARTLLRKTRLLILDEATAAVDLETDELIQNTIQTEFADCTVLTIAHRIGTIMDSDRVLVMDKGRVAEFDNPNTLLLDKNSIFYSMAKESGLAS